MTVVRTRPAATLSLDLDNEWSYLKTHGDASWVELPSYLDRAVDHGLALCSALDVRITWFVVGQDAAIDAHRESLARLVAAGHEVGNHSYHHEPWIHAADRSAVAVELDRAEDAIELATGIRPDAFRGPGYAMSPVLLHELARRGYRYDASSLPTIIGPLARAYYFRRTRLDTHQRAERAALFGSWRDARRPLRPYRWKTAPRALLELPVTVVPGARVPFHVSYVLYLAARSQRLARAYFVTALGLCKAAHVAPSILLHPLDLLGGDEVQSLAFFPAMGMRGADKRDFVETILAAFVAEFDVGPLREFAATFDAVDLPLRDPGVRVAHDSNPS